MRMTLALALSAALVAVSCGKPARPAAPVALARANPYELEVGKKVYQSYCVGCHGDAGAGDGFNSFNLDPHPRDLADPAFQKKRTNAELADAIRRGGAGVGLTSLMPPWGHTLDDQHINDVVLYVRSLRR